MKKIYKRMIVKSIYKRNWKGYTDFLPGRTSEQIRSHAQKFEKRTKKEQEEREQTQKAMEEIAKNLGRPKRDRKPPSRYEPEW